MTEPQPRHKQRATTDLQLAVAMVGFACAAHHGAPEDALGILDELSDAEKVDVGRALGTLLVFQLGATDAQRALDTVDATDLYAVADLVAQTVDYDGWITLDAFQGFGERAAFSDIADRTED